MNSSVHTISVKGSPHKQNPIQNILNDDSPMPNHSRTIRPLQQKILPLNIFPEARL
jgi:hypothetical protein